MVCGGAMSNKPTGGPAFPGVDHLGEAYPGMHLRDYFAAKAMQAYINSFVGQSPDWRDADQWVPDKAYEMADSMLEARKS